MKKSRLDEKPHELAVKEFGRYSEMYAYWMRYAATSMPLINAGGATAILGYLGESSFSPVAIRRVFFPLLIYVVGMAVGATVVIIRIFSTMSRRRKALAHLRALVSGDEWRPEDNTIYTSTVSDPVSLFAILVSACLFVLATIFALIIVASLAWTFTLR